ncbi:FAD-dependent oxidoreductase [Roseospira goensis]|uniref:Fumarate reductase flavoprotein subunit n=1 Tax=Roseospira goensis TaxID=391922 RepID=A0A7W6S059_9PROT|nr:fumarate reductase flavoprotein subunit [Roseospira goensis]
MQFDVETDVVVVGGGGGGLVAALTAREAGAEVAILEKSERLGGNTALSSGSIPGAGTRFQVAAGIADGWERLAEDIHRRTRGTAPRDLVEVLARESAPLVEWLVDAVGLPLDLMADLKKVGHSVPRLHAPVGRQGQTLVTGLERAAQAAGVLISPGNPVSGLLTVPGDDGPRVVGVSVGAGDDAEGYTVGARCVILAANGFGANRALLRRYIPEIAEAPYFGHLGNAGEAIGWAADLGAHLVNMGAYQGHASIAQPHGALLSWAAVERGGLLVNREGRRFVDETLGYSGCASAVLAQPGGQGFVVYDGETHDYLAEKAEDYRDLMHFGGVMRADDAATLAVRAGLDPAALEETLADYAEAASGARPDPFGRSAFGQAPLRPPLCLVRVTAGLFHTQGGVDVDAAGRVRCANGAVIPNLYAVGGVAVGVSGAHGGAGYCSANGLLAALGLGRLAGRDAARRLS